MGQSDIKQLVVCEGRLEPMREGQNVNEKKQMSSNGEGKVNVTKVLKGLHTKAKKRKRLQKNECTQTRVYKQTYLLMVFL